MPLVRNQLRSDDVMERLSQYSTAQFRVIVLLAFVAAMIAGTCVTVFGHGIVALLSACGTLVVAIVGAHRFSRERMLMERNSIAVATVSHWTKREGIDGGYVYDVRYRFLASDGRVYMGSGSSNHELPQVDSTLPVLYRTDDPSRNLPLASFWFYRFSYAGTE